MAERKTARRSTASDRAERAKQEKQKQTEQEAKHAADEIKHQQAEGKAVESPDEVDLKDKRQEAFRMSAEQKLHSLLDDPMHPDQASPRRGFIYFAVIVLFALALNLTVLIVMSGGR